MNNTLYTDKRGYLRFRDSNKLVSRYNAEKKIGRRLKPNEVVHHKNRNKRDNRRENLRVMTKEHHNNSHKFSKKKTGRW